MTAFTKSDLGQTITGRFEQQVTAHADLTAVQSDGVSVTYDALNRLANRLARAIVAAVGDGEQVVALFLDHGAFIMAGLFGALKAGKLYLCVNPDDPSARVAGILGDCDAALVVTQRSLAARAAEACPKGVPILFVEEAGSDLPDDNLGLDIPPDRPCALYYTSASTGTSKGVVITHPFCMHFGYLAQNVQNLRDGDRLGLHFSCGFAFSLAPIFGALLNGMSLHLFPMKAEGLTRMLEWVRDEEINYLAMKI
jgi:non-ribosomal peptide synthetase component F